MSTNPDPELERLLQRWQVDASAMPQFQSRVWQRIASAETPAAGASLGLLLAAWLYPFRRPAVAVAYTLALLLAGAGAGWWRGQADAQQLDAQLARQYVQSISPQNDALP